MNGSSAPNGSPAPRRLRLWAGLALLVVIGVSLRAPIVAIAPLTGAMRDDLDVSAAVVGSLTGIAVLVFGLLAPASLTAARWVSLDRLIWFALLAIAVGSAVRVTPTLLAVALGTLIAACGIAFGNVLLPAVVRRDFASHLPVATSVYAATLSAGGALAAAATLPMLLALDTTWNRALALWAVPPAIAVLLWLPRLFRASAPLVGARTPLRLLHSRRVIALSVFMGAQSAIYFTTNAWLPSILRDSGYGEVAAGGLLGLLNVCNVAGAALAPLLAGRPGRRARVALGVAALTTLSLTTLIVFPQAALGAVVILGAVQGAGLGLALLLIAVLADSPRQVVAVSALVQGVGYVLAAAAPVVAGFLFDATHGWTWPLVALVLVATVQGIAGRVASARS